MSHSTRGPEVVHRRPPTGRTSAVVTALLAVVTLLVGGTAAAHLVATSPGAGQGSTALSAPPEGAPAAPGGGGKAGHRSTWQTSWATAPSYAQDTQCRDCTIRNVVHLSAGGDGVRVRLSNANGAVAQPVGSASVALAAVPGSSQPAPNTLRGLTFRGRSTVSIPAGGSVLSDPVALSVQAGRDLLVSTFTPGYAGPMTLHDAAAQTSFLTSGPDRTRSLTAADFPTTTTHWYFVTDVQVFTRQIAGTVVTFGDSITDGVGSTPSVDHRWPDLLAARSAASRNPLAVANSGISGNQVLGDRPTQGIAGISRFQRDVLDRAGVTDVVIMLGINDIQQVPHQTDATKITAGLARMARQARAKGITVVGATLTPFEGWKTWTPELDAVRGQVNAWIRAGGDGLFDHVVDFDAVVRDPARPSAILPLYDSGDHLHPGDIGYAAMADAVDLRWLN